MRWWMCATCWLRVIARYLLSDGSLLIFAQDQRGVSAGLAFNF